jgi:hypothetical protein
MKYEEVVDLWWVKFTVNGYNSNLFINRVNITKEERETILVSIKYLLVDLQLSLNCRETGLLLIA